MLIGQWALQAQLGMHNCMNFRLVKPVIPLVLLSSRTNGANHVC